jgi:hypothetical protein
MRVPIPLLGLMAVLLPGCGDGLLPKVYPDPSSPAEEDGRPMTPSQDPGIITQDCYLDPCGGYSWGVNFVLPMPAQSSGWIVPRDRVRPLGTRRPDTTALLGGVLREGGLQAVCLFPARC